MSALRTLIMILLMLESIYTDEEEAHCALNHKCVPVAMCRECGDILYPCYENFTHVCCSEDNVLNPDTPVIQNRLKLFPTDCGIVSVTDRIIAGELAAVGQFPWMALLGYTQKGINIVQFLCGGSIITKNYILTAAHCTSIDVRLKLQVVRLGEYNLETAEDCQGSICSKHIDIGVDQVIVHEQYNNKTLENDIAIIKLRKDIIFTEFIRPICLPFDNETDHSILPGAKLIVSGWGKTDSGNLGGSTKLMFTAVNIWDPIKCNNSVPPRVRPIKESQICANGKEKQDSCKGDSGGPLVNSTLIGEDYRSYQVGIVSFASALICGNVELPTIYTKVDYYEDWIIDNVV